MWVLLKTIFGTLFFSHSHTKEAQRCRFSPTDTDLQQRHQRAARPALLHHQLRRLSLSFCVNWHGSQTRTSLLILDRWLLWWDASFHVSHVSVESDSFTSFQEWTVCCLHFFEGYIFLIPSWRWMMPNILLMSSFYRGSNRWIGSESPGIFRRVDPATATAGLPNSVRCIQRLQKRWKIQDFL